MRKNILHFTAATLEALKPAAPGKRDYYNDDDVKGFQVGVTDKGTITYYVYKKVGGKPTRFAIARFPDLKVPKARDKARALIGKLAEGENPHVERKKAEALKLTLSEAFETYLSVRKLRPQSTRTCVNLTSANSTAKSRYGKSSLKAGSTRIASSIT